MLPFPLTFIEGLVVLRFRNRCPSTTVLWNWDWLCLYFVLFINGLSFFMILCTHLWEVNSLLFRCFLLGNAELIFSSLGFKNVGYLGSLLSPLISFTHSSIIDSVNKNLFIWPCICLIFMYDSVNFSFKLIFKIKIKLCFIKSFHKSH